MISALLSFLGGGVFRAIWGEISAYLTARQDQRHEMERMRLQGELEAAAHARNLEAIRVQAQLGVQTIRVQAEGEVGKMETGAWLTAVEGTMRSTGIRWLDAWNGVIRPATATFCLVLIGLHFYRKDWVLDDNGWMLCSAALGLFLADRTLFKRGK